MSYCKITERDVETLRALATRYMSYALSDENIENRKLWIALNNMNMQKPMVTINQIPWKEMDVDGFLDCTIEDPYFRDLEKILRRDIYKWEHMRADMVLNPYIGLNRPITDTDIGVKTLVTDNDPQSSALSHLYEDQFAEMEDVEKIKTPVITLDKDKENEILDIAHRIFDGIAPIKLKGMMLHCGLWDHISFRKGVENCYIDLIDRPELIHAIMERYTNAYIAKIEQLNAMGLYDAQENVCHCSHTFVGKESEIDPPEFATTQDSWTFTMAQIFTSVSPAVNEEFEIPYMSRILSHFGSVYYGCCERLDDRLNIIDRLPNIRKVSCSPWSDRENFAAKLPKKYIMSNKPTPSLLATSTLDEDTVRKDIRRTIAAAKANGLGLELLLKDISTVKNDPKKLWRWSEIAKEETISSVI